MSLYDYQASKKISELDPPFNAIIMAAIRKADSVNSTTLRVAFSDVWDEMQARYNAPGGVLSDDPEKVGR